MNNKGLWLVVGIIVLAILAWWLWSGSQEGGFLGTINGQVSTSTNLGGEGGMAAQSGTVSTARRASDVASIASSISGASTFASLFASTGVKAAITGPGPYTIFVPTDGAISLLSSGTISGMSAAEKKRLIEYHVISGRAVDPAGIERGSLQALSGDALNFEVSDLDETARVNSAFAIKAYQGTNGVVYLISGVLLPPFDTNSEQ
ncbi:MAG: fasciclin domain-containing protein [Patescibacteria group bacterium]|nr:fasciclin domain-containing protein [Patescibacteria group bacterium]